MYGRALSANSVQALHRQKTPGTRRRKKKNYSMTFKNYNHARIKMTSPFCTHFYI